MPFTSTAASSSRTAAVAASTRRRSASDSDFPPPPLDDDDAAAAAASLSSFHRFHASSPYVIRLKMRAKISRSSTSPRTTWAPTSFAASTAAKNSAPGTPPMTAPTHAYATLSAVGTNPPLTTTRGASPNVPTLWCAVRERVDSARSTSDASRPG